MRPFEQLLAYRLANSVLYYLVFEKGRGSLASFVFFVLTKKGLKNVTADIACSLELKRNRRQEIRFSIGAGAEEIADQLSHKLSVDVELVNMKRV